MPRKPIVRTNFHYYHICGRSNNKEYFYLPIPVVWNIMTSKLGKLQKEFDLKIGAFVLMNNHFHLLVLTPKEDIDRVMYFFMKEVTLQIQKSTGRINKIFGGRYKGSVIEDYAYLLNVYKYIYRNPIEGGLSEKAETYPYSTIFPHEDSLPFLVENFFPHQSHELQWINQKFNKTEATSISAGLRKTVFAYQKDNTTGRPIEPSFCVPLKEKCAGTH